MPGPNTPYTQLSQSQVLQQSFDESQDLLRVGIVGATLAPIQVGGLSVQIDHTEDSIRLGNGTDYLTSTTNGLKIGLDVNIINDTLAVTQSGTWNINNISGTISLPTGAATSANQTNGTQKTQIFDGTDTALINGDGDLQTVQYKKYSTLNSTTSTLLAGATFTGTAEETDKFSNVVVNIKASHDSATDGLVMEFSHDGTNWDTSDVYTISASSGESFSASLSAKYFRIRYTNGAVNQTYFRLSTTFFPGTPKSSSHRLTDVLDGQNDAEVVKAVLAGKTDGGNYLDVPIDPNGHLEVAVHSPRTSYSQLSVESLSPIIQSDAVYGLNNTDHLTYTNASGTLTNGDSTFLAQTGTTIYGAGSLISRKRVRYRPGQGINFRFSSLWGPRVESSYAISGAGNSEDGVYLGYVPNSVHGSTEFGVLYTRAGVLEVQTLTITTASTTAENVTVTLAGTAFSVPVTNSASTLKTAYEISTFTYTGWDAEQVGSTVIFRATSAGNKTGTFSITGTTVVGSFAETRAGVLPTETFIPQSQWNGDKFDGTGNSSIILDPTKFNLYQLKFHGQDAGGITIEILDDPESNNPTFIRAHTIKSANNLTTTLFVNSSFQYVMSAYSYGSTTNALVKTSGYSAFIEGAVVFHGNRFSYFGQKTSVVDSQYTPIFTIRNGRTFKSKTNQTVINVISLDAALKHTNPCTIFLIRNATLGGTPNFTAYDSDSCTYIDTAATSCTFANRQLMWSGTLGDTGNLDHDFSMDNLTVQPGETITVAARSASGSANFVVASLNSREDQ